MKNKRSLKLCLCGSYGVGKTSIRRRFMDDQFTRRYTPTVGADFSNKKIEFDNKEIEVLIHDLAGEKQFRKMRSLYFEGAHGALIVFDVTDKKSFHEMEEWIMDLENLTITNGIPFLIIANKVDLVNNGQTQVVSNDEINQFISNLNDRFDDQFRVEFMETSAYENKNIDDVFDRLIEKVLNWLPIREEKIREIKEDQNRVKTTSDNRIIQN